MATVKSFIQRVINLRPEVVPGKKYNYKCVDHGDYWNIYRQWLDGYPWELHVVVPKGDENDTSTWCRT